MDGDAASGQTTSRFFQLSVSSFRRPICLVRLVPSFIAFWAALLYSAVLGSGCSRRYYGAGRDGTGLQQKASVRQVSRLHRKSVAGHWVGEKRKTSK
ncbi:hypothetical protein VTL71DRAFT_1815 [Oculimacula yallundae]|uniref:Transmembrane protein n=1 Tax=Oculimacula yallundae TaxID=86028 RepID=A0ABR4CCB2_9HELO